MPGRGLAAKLGLVERREFLQLTLLAAGAVALGACSDSSSDRAIPTTTGEPEGEPVRYGPLRPPDANGLALPDGFSGRVVARAGERVPGTDYEWHIFPDGGATFATDNGGWVYVSNSEVPDGGGVGALRFDRGANIVAAYPILTGTSTNCAGGATPWGTWLSCEETDAGRVWECDPSGDEPGVARPALGTFTHEAVAVADERLYLTEDVEDGALYRFTPASPRDLTDGRLEVAVVDELDAKNGLRWVEVPEPNPGPDDTPTREQIAGATRFDGGEGICAAGDRVNVTTKGDNRVWRIDLRNSSLHVAYDASTVAEPVLTGVDNVTITPNGDLWVVEDGGDMEVVIVGTDGVAEPFARVTEQEGSELTGPAFDPAGHRLYFSSQRGGDGGLTYEVTGPFRVA
ncbi:MAG: alkaline phosphatase PhoX, partial [Acidimicrobiia bacterium]